MQMIHLSTTSSIAILLLTVICISFLPIANGQPVRQLPVLLIHGYIENSDVWNDWVEKLKSDGIQPKAVTFSVNDECGSAKDHGIELNQIVKDFKKETGEEKINIVAHSKGGLDARVYLANNLSNSDVANLIMIGTPNAGSPLAAEAVKEGRIFCEPALFDLVPDAPATHAKKNPNTKYFTISGNWVSQFIPFTIIDRNCPEDPFTFSFLDRGRSHISGPDDGLVPQSSSKAGFASLGTTNNCHPFLFSDEEYDRVITILKPNM